MSPSTSKAFHKSWCCKLEGAAGSIPGIPIVDPADEECFSIDLDVNSHQFGDEVGDVDLALNLLASDSPDSQLEGLQITEQNLEAEAWLSKFIRSGQTFRPPVWIDACVQHTYNSQHSSVQTGWGYVWS